ncbi:MAG TPA: DinB family protein [Asanoa sp.]
MGIDWNGIVVGQLQFYWSSIFRPRLGGLTDDEYFWEPVEGCWSLRRGDDGAFHLDGGEGPEPSPPPFTTIAWRLVHIGVGFATRASAFFGDSNVPADASMFDPRRVPGSLPGSAAEGLAFLDRVYAWWTDGIAALSDDEMATPLGPRGAYFANDPMGALVVHINRETMHHGAEICLLRDLYRASGAASRDSRFAPR